VIVLAGVLAKVIDARMGRHTLDPAAATRYRVLRRSIFSAIVFVGVLSALLVIPQIRADRRGDPCVGRRACRRARIRRAADDRQLHRRHPDRVQPTRAARRRGRGRGRRGIVEEIGLTYTWVRLPTTTAS
jgi:hypothetical protein